jgi:hypothetical protein
MVRDGMKKNRAQVLIRMQKAEDDATNSGATASLPMVDKRQKDKRIKKNGCPQKNSASHSQV